MDRNYIYEEIKGHSLEYFDDDHIYLVDGVIVPSITQLLKIKFNNKYSAVNQTVLNNAADKGTAMHNAIENYCKLGEDDGSVELRNFKFLERQYKFEVLDNEVPIILFDRDGTTPIAAGRFDLELEENGHIGLGDLKRTSTLDKDYLGYQLNLYRIGYQQCYEREIEFLRGIHLRDNTRKYVNIPTNEELAWELVEEWKNANTTSKDTTLV